MAPSTTSNKAARKKKESAKNRKSSTFNKPFAHALSPNMPKVEDSDEQDFDSTPEFDSDDEGSDYKDEPSPTPTRRDSEGLPIGPDHPRVPNSMNKAGKSKKAKANEDPNGRHKGRHLVNWHRPRMIEKLILHLQYECHRDKYTIPWDRIVHRLSPGSSGASAIQNLNKVRKVLISEGHLIPPALGKPGEALDPTIRGYVRDEDKFIQDKNGNLVRDYFAMRTIGWDELYEDRKESLTDHGITRGSGKYNRDEVKPKAREGTPYAPATNPHRRAKSATAQLKRKRERQSDDDDFGDSLAAGNSSGDEYNPHAVGHKKARTGKKLAFTNIDSDSEEFEESLGFCTPAKNIKNESLMTPPASRLVKLTAIDPNYLCQLGTGGIVTEGSVPKVAPSPILSPALPNPGTSSALLLSKLRAAKDEKLRQDMVDTAYNKSLSPINDTEQLGEAYAVCTGSIPNIGVEQFVGLDMSLAANSHLQPQENSTVSTHEPECDDNFEFFKKNGLTAEEIDVLLADMQNSNDDNFNQPLIPNDHTMAIAEQHPFSHYSSFGAGSPEHEYGEGTNDLDFDIDSIPTYTSMLDNSFSGEYYTYGGDSISEY